MKKKNRPSTGSGTFLEQYEVRLVYQQDGFFVHHTELVGLQIPHGQNEKNNHDQARQEAETRFPGCRIKNVTYL